MEYDLDLEKIMHLEAKLVRRYEPFSVIGDNKKMLSTLPITAPLCKKDMISKTISVKKKCEKNNLNLDKITDYLSNDKINYIRENKHNLVIKKL